MLYINDQNNLYDQRILKLMNFKLLLHNLYIMIKLMLLLYTALF